MAFDQKTRNLLQRFVADARTLLAEEFTRQLQATYGMNPKTGEVANIQTLSGLTPNQQETAHLLRDTLVHYLANAEKGKEKTRNAAAIERIVREQAFTVLNRLAALRMSEARGFLIESLAKGYDSKGFQLFHRVAGNSLGETGDAYRHYLFSLFDEFSLDLSVLFDRFSVQGRLFPSSPILLKLLGLINDESIAPLWAEDETIGWIYQYFNTQEERKKMREQSQAPRNSRELAVRNQFFTPRYVVEFLTDNTLGRIWYEMTQGKTGLTQSCKYLVRRPNERFLAPDEIAPEPEDNLELSQEELLQQTVYIQHRALKDPRDIRMLDPACGSMHFGLYAFDLFEAIYSEAWDLEATQGIAVFTWEHDKTPITSEYKDKAEFLADVPRLIIENNIHGVDIDPRAVQIAGLSLWLRAHNSWQQAGIKPQARPKIQRSNIVCAEPMPGEKALLQEFTASLKPTVLGQLVEVIFEKMELAGEAGTLLKIEQEIQDAIAEAKALWLQQNQAFSLFPDLAKIAKQRGEIEFDVSDINDEGFWEQAEQKILTALADYAQQATTDESGQKRLFADDAAKGFAFIELCHKRFDVVLMNPPFGESSEIASGYIQKTYRYWNKNILCAFTERLFNLINSTGFVASVIDRSPLNKSTYEEFRNGVLLSKGALEFVCDLGWAVLDANVEVSSIILKGNASPQSETLFIDVRNEVVEDKRINLLKKITNNEIYIHKTGNFIKFPNSALVYDLPDGLLSLFARYDSYNENGFTAYTGHQLQSDRHFRLFWEVSTNEELGAENKFCYLYNGGAFTRYSNPKREIVRFGSYSKIGSENFTSYSYRIQNKDKHFKQGVGFGKRGDFLDAHLIEKDTIFTVEGQCIPIDSDNDRFLILGLLNSTLTSRLLNTYSGQHKYSGYVNLLPIPDINSNSNIKINIIDAVRKIILIKEYYYAEDETTIYFKQPYLFNIHKDTKSAVSDFKSKLLESERDLKLLHNQVDCLSLQYYGIKDALSLNELNEYANKTPKEGVYRWSNLNEENIITNLVNDFLSYCVGLAFGRWLVNSSCLSTEKKLNKDIISSENLSQYLIYETQKVDKSDVINFSITHLKLENIEQYIVHNRLFFDFHLQRYTCSGRASPVYWPLQTLSGSYTLWLYYHHLSDQTLFTCVNDFVEPSLESVNKKLVILRDKHSRNKDEEKEFDRLTDLKAELEDFRDELLRIAKFWKPNLHDGIEITAAPLWRLFQHRTWQNKLKQTWEKLEEGGADWSHLACSVWPVRVLRKCYQDRSLAIAHDVEDDLWHEIDVIKGRNKKREWQPKPLSDGELNAYIQAKIQAMGHLNEH